jgi:hypothetical protein
LLQRITKKIPQKNYGDEEVGKKSSKGSSKGIEK